MFSPLIHQSQNISGDFITATSNGDDLSTSVTFTVPQDKSSISDHNISTTLDNFSTTSSRILISTARSTNEEKNTTFTNKDEVTFTEIYTGKPGT